MWIGTPMPGCPDDLTNRECVETQTYQILEKFDISYERVDHDAAATIEECHAVEAVLNCRICKNLFLCNRQKTEFYLLLLDGDKPFKTKYLSAQIHSARLSFASPEDMLRILNVTPGSASILAMAAETAREVHLLIDQSVMKEKYIGCHPCKNTSSLKILLEDLLLRFLPQLGIEPVYVDLPTEEHDEGTEN